MPSYCPSIKLPCWPKNQNAAGVSGEQQNRGHVQESLWKNHKVKIVVAAAVGIVLFTVGLALTPEVTIPMILPFAQQIPVLMIIALKVTGLVTIAGCAGAAGGALLVDCFRAKPPERRYEDMVMREQHREQRLYLIR